jgi:DNA repair protein RecO (recombination protein O)
MVSKTNGIVLNYIKYKETSIISKIYTKEFGLKSYLINGVRTKKGKFNISSFQPLSLLELVVYENKNSQIGRIKELKFDKIYFTNHHVQKKISICLFISEVLLKLITFQVPDKNQFNFVRNSLIELDKIVDNYENFHIIFLIKFSKYLGFEISNISDISNIKFESELVISFLSEIIISEYSSNIKSTSSVRNKALEIIIVYFREKTELNINFNSNRILKNIFN